LPGIPATKIRSRTAVKKNPLATLGFHRRRIFPTCDCERVSAILGRAASVRCVGSRASFAAVVEGFFATAGALSALPVAVLLADGDTEWRMVKPIGAAPRVINGEAIVALR
jgi:hypothetical protein